jgi:hypothetical protein
MDTTSRAVRSRFAVLKETSMRSLLARFRDWLLRKNVPPALTGPQWTGTRFVDAYKRNRAPTPNEIMAELKNTAWTCASINAAVCASFPPRLYVATRRGQSAPKCFTKALSRADEHRLREMPHLALHTRGIDQVQEVTDHPLLTLLAQVNPVHNAFDLWELTTLYQEVHGATYWFVDAGPLGTPRAVWLLPT